MEKIVEITARLVKVTRLVYAKKAHFLALFACILLGSILMLGSLDLLPNALSTVSDNILAVVSGDLEKSRESALVATIPSPPVKVEAPLQITIPSLGLVSIISNPETTNVATLDTLLLKGAVRYPTSAKLGESGNVVLFGHSSYLPVVRNKAYKTFNEIQKLSAGAVVTVSSSGMVYTYKVRTVVKQSANDGTIPLLVTGRVLTLVTCNTFATKSDRFVVTADLVESHVLGA